MLSKETLKKTLIISLVIMTVIAFMPSFGAGEAYAAKKKAKPKGRLVKTVKYEQMIDGAWKKLSQTSYTYNKKKDPKTIKQYDYYLDGTVSAKYVFNYSFKYRKNGKRLSSTMKTEGDQPGTVRKWNYDKYGHLTKYEFRDDEWSNVVNVKYTKTGYLKTLSESSSSIDNGSDQWAAKCSVSLKKGLPVKMNCYYQASDWGKACTVSFYKKPTSKKGLIYKKSYTESRDKKSFSYKMKNGRVRSVTVTVVNNAGEKSKERYTFYYTKKQAGKVRYATMINSLIDNGYSGYEFRWF